MIVGLLSERGSNAVSGAFYDVIMLEQWIYTSFNNSRTSCGHNEHQKLEFGNTDPLFVQHDE